MSEGLGVVIVILVMIVIALQVWSMWPEGDDGWVDLDLSNPVGFASYDPEEHEDEGEPYEV